MSESFKKKYEAHIKQFIATGDRISFGRLEGMKEAAESLELPELAEWCAEISRKNHDAMAAQTS